MKTRRSLSVFLHLFVLVALTLVGCAAPPETSTVPTQQTQPASATAAPTTQDGIPLAFADPNKKVRIALVREVGEGSFFERYLAGAQSMANELGVELLEATARGDMAKMVTAMENFIQQGVDAIIVDHGRPDPLLPKIEEALAKGIKVVSFDLVVDNPQVPEIEQDDMLIGFLLAKKVVTDHAGQADVVYVNVGGFAPLDKRDRIWQSFKWRYPGLKEVTRIGAVTDNTAADTQTRMEATMKEYPNANVVVAMWDEFAKGAVRAITQAGRAKDYQVYSVDITNEDIQLMIAPDSPWVATVATDSYSVGRLAVRTAAALVAGEKVDKYLLVQPQLITRDFLLANKITNMDELIQAMPAMGESSLNWFPWMEKVLARNGYSMPQITIGAGGEMSSQPICQVKSDQIPSVFTNKKVRIALVREVGEGSFFERYLAGAQSMANELGVELLEATARGDMAKMVTAMENFIQQGVDAIIVDHGRPDPLLPKIEEALAKGIKVVSFDLVVDNPQVPEIEQDDMLIGFLLAKKVVTDHAGQADVVYVNVGGFAPLDKRDRIWQSFKWRYPGLKEVTRIGAVTDNTAADTQTRMEATMKEYPNANVVVAMWDEFAKGAVRAITQAGRAKDYQVYSVDITNEDIQLMIAPDSPWVATVATDSYSVGRLAVRTAAALVAGEKVDKYLLVQPQLITRDFLLANKITNMDELIQAMPAMGESPLNWFPWMCTLAGR
ncbi:MAG: sugar ABC transporter substrate-binding protein [Chloroflexus sp.]|nr:sugar ABC transporter substrate-binding protein [Chloroflexus sp.]